jgi:hypothetical protein
MRRAYVTLLYDDFLLAVRTLGRALEGSGTSADKVVIVAGQVSEQSRKVSCWMREVSLIMTIIIIFFFVVVVVVVVVVIMIVINMTIITTTALLLTTIGTCAILTGYVRLYSPASPRVPRQLLEAEGWRLSDVPPFENPNKNYAPRSAGTERIPVPAIAVDGY